MAEERCSAINCPIQYTSHCNVEEKGKCPYYTPMDPVNSPSHYVKGGMECIEVIHACLTPEEFQGACTANVIKYIWRWREKAGVEDLKKARKYLDWLIKSAEGENK